MIGRARAWVGRRSPAQIGAVGVVVAVLVFGLVMNRDRLQTGLRKGERIAADFPVRPKVIPLQSRAKVAGLGVGVVTGIEDRPDGTSRVVMKVGRGTRSKLGTEPSAAARPTILLSGQGPSTYIDLRPGGDRGRAPDVIPPERTSVAVELDHVLDPLTEDVRAGLTDTVDHLDAALASGTDDALREFLDAAAPTLAPAAPALSALRGEQPGDLEAVIAHLGRAAEVLTEHRGQLEATVDGLATVAQRLATRSPELVTVLERLPATLTDARSALVDVDGTLNRLERTAPPARPSIAELKLLLQRAGPLLAKARPLLSDVGRLAGGAQPIVDDLTPVARDGQLVLASLEGPVLDRLGRDVVPALLSPYQGSDSVLYQDIAYALAGLDGILKYRDEGGGYIRVSPLTFHEPGYTPWKASPPAGPARRMP